MAGDQDLLRNCQILNSRTCRHMCRAEEGRERPSNTDKGFLVCLLFAKHTGHCTHACPPWGARGRERNRG